MRIKTKLQLISEIQALADKLKKIPSRKVFEQKVVGGRYAMVNFFDDNYTDLLKAAKLESYKERLSLSQLSPEEKNLKNLHVALAGSRQDIKLLRKQIAELTQENLSSDKLKSMINVLNSRKLNFANPTWLSPQKIKKNKGIPLLFLSDIHFDEVVLPEQIQGVNSYNRDIAIKRLQHTFNQAINLLKHEIHEPEYSGIVLALGGDMLSGNIHEELAETNEAAILQSLLKLLDILISGITKLEAAFGKVFVPCVVGNHGRLFKKPRAKNKVFDNYEWLIYQFLVKHFSNNPNITFLIPDGPDCIFKIHNLTFLLTHGDQFRGGAGISGIYTPLMLGMYRKQQKNSIIQQNFDVMMCGHFHQLIMTPNLIINGSVKGYDEFANIMNFKPERPQQALMIIHQDLGITHQMPIFCDSYQGSSSKTKISCFS